MVKNCIVLRDMLCSRIYTIKLILPVDLEVCKTSPIRSLIRNDGFGHSIIRVYGFSPCPRLLGDKRRVARSLPQYG